MPFVLKTVTKSLVDLRATFCTVFKAEDKSLPCLHLLRSQFLHSMLGPAAVRFPCYNSPNEVTAITTKLLQVIGI